MPNIIGAAAKPPTMDLYGTFGSFGVPGSRFLVKYFSTFANSSHKGGHAALLKELKPMRDRVAARDLKNLGSLLQRDLNDTRVAQDLVPYLRDAEIAFFPAVLAVLMPIGYLLPGSQAKAPYPKPTSLESCIDFDGCWSTERYRFAENEPELPLGLLRIALNRAEIVVLDGQHRANAFRFLSGAFDPVGTIYQAFYGPKPPGTLSADLPVTIIWFESASDEQIDPKLISRRLFVDVNNNAKPVSPARTILLDDRTVTCIATQEVYNRTAERGFIPDQFSLLHGAFDMPDDLATSPLPRTAITAPEIVEDVLKWAFFGSTAHDQVHIWHVKKMSDQGNLARFQQIFPNVGVVHVRRPDQDEVASGVRFVTAAGAADFRLRVSSDYGPVINQLFEGLALLKFHYGACKNTNDWISNVAGTTLQEVWERVFCGGEGLYWILRGDGATTERGETYRNAISEIESYVSGQRATLMGASTAQTDAVFKTVATKVFQVGFVMAVDFLARIGDGDRVVAAEMLCRRLNQFTGVQWVNILTEFRAALMGSTGTTPRMWPSFRNLFLRMYDGETQELYGAGSWANSPEFRVYSNGLEGTAAALAQTIEEMPSEAEIKKIAQTEFKRLEQLVKACGLSASWFAESQFVKEGEQLLMDKLGSAFSETVEQDT